MNTQIQIEQIQDIIQNGAAAVLEHKQDMAALDSLIASLRAQEQSFYSKIQGKQISSARDLNLFIQELDFNRGLSQLLPGGEVERLLGEKYDLGDTSTKTMSTTERNLIREVINRLVAKGLPLIKRQVVNTKARATILADVKQKLYAALQMGINVTVSEKVAIVDTTYISPLLSKETADELLGYVNMNIKLNSIKGSQAKHDFKETIVDGQLVEVAIKEESTLDGLSLELRQYLLSIAPDVLGPDYKVIMKEDGFIVDDSESIKPLGSVTISQLKQDTLDIIYKLVPMSNSIINHFSDQIAINRSISGIRGFLGELRASLLMTEIFGQNEAYKLISTGLIDKIRLTKDGQLQEAPLDFVVKALNTLYGIQVKNTIDTSYSWEGEMSAASFYLQRLQVNMSPAEKAFFGAFSYNKPLSPGEVKDDWNDWNLYRSTIYPQFEQMFGTNFSSTFKTLVGNIIRLSTQTSGDNAGIFSGETSLTNNFFIMNNKIIAASDIMLSLQDAISGDERGIKATFKMNTGDGPVWQYGSPEPANTNYTGNITTIDYNVTLKYKTLAKSAYNLA